MEGRTKEQIKAHMDLYNESQDIWLIHNPDEEDFTFFYNRKFEPNPYIIPGKNKDIGFGKGNLEIRYYLAKVYVEKKGEQMIMAISKADWDKKKDNYRQEERGQMEERLALRVTNKELWKKVTPQLILGRVRRSTEGVGIGEAIADKPVDPSLSNVEQIMHELGLNERELSAAHEAQKQELTDEDKRKQDLINSIQ
jgi:hypothetical protein